MALPFFYTRQFDASQTQVTLDEDSSAHIVQVLRMKQFERLQLTDGRGNLAVAQIAEPHKKHCVVTVEKTVYREPLSPKTSIGISLIRNASRFEWFLEKAVEIGINEIIPLLTERTVKEKFRYDRMNGICISAMLQSQQCWLPVLHQPVLYELLFRQEEVAAMHHKLIAHCLDNDRQSIPGAVGGTDGGAIILIGPEGDFTPAEIALALQHNFIQVSLGETRLRTETAGIVAASLLRLG